MKRGIAGFLSIGLRSVFRLMVSPSGINPIITFLITKRC